MLSILLFPGIPGVTELIVILLMMAVFLVVPLALVIGAYLFGKRRGRAETTDDNAADRVE